MAKTDYKGLFLWSYHFNQKYGVSTFLKQEKTHILNNYLNKQMPQLFQSRAEAAFNNQLDISQIDDFMLGANGNKGYIAQLQKFFDEYYAAEFRNAEQIFTGELNKILYYATKNGSFSVQDLKLNKEQEQSLTRMLQAQDVILDAMSKLSSLTEPYILATAGAHKTKGRALTLKSLKNGTYKKDSFDEEGKQALAMWEKIKSVEKELKMNVAGNKQSMSQNFKCFRETAKAFHSLYGEYLLTVAAYHVGKKMGEAEQSLINIAHSGSQTYNIGVGTINMEIKNDPNLEAHLKNGGFDFHGKSFTAKDDARISATADGITGVFGGSVKEYSDKSVETFKGWTQIDSYNNIYQAASLATQYGLPFTYATTEFINSLGGALYGEYGDSGESHRWWEQYMEFLGQLLFLDALMGRTANGVISERANSLLYVKNGEIKYVGEIIKDIAINNIQASSRGLWASGIENFKHFDRSPIEESHYKAFYSHEDPSVAWEEVSQQIKKVNLKIRINLNNLLSKW